MERALHTIEEAQLPELSLLVFDLHWSRGEFARCEELLEQLQREVRDPYLDAMRANTLVMRGEHERARELALRAREAVPEVRETWIALMNPSVGCGDHALSLEAMQHLAGEFGMPPAEIEEGYDLEAFHGSPQGEEWAAWLAAR